MKKLFFVSALLIQLMMVPSASAFGTSINDIFEGFRQGIEDQSEEIQPGGPKLVLPTYFDVNRPSEDGLSGIIGVIETLLDFMKLITAPVALIFITVMGMRMIAAGGDNEEVLTKSKNYIIYAVQGLIIIFMADTLVQVTFGTEGEIFRGGQAGAIEGAQRTALLIQGIYSLVQAVIGVIALFMLVLAGMRYIGGSYSEDQIAGAKRMIVWSLAGLFVVAISEFVVKRILFVNQGEQIGFTAAKSLITDLTGFAASTIGMISFAALIYAGFLYVTARDNEDNVAKAKNIIFGAFVGILIALGAFAFTNTLVTLDGI